MGSSAGARSTAASITHFFGMWHSRHRKYVNEILCNSLPYQGNGWNAVVSEYLSYFGQVAATVSRSDSSLLKKLFN
jgi:hypothetical protein